MAVDFSTAFDSIENRHIYGNVDAGFKPVVLKQILTERKVRYEDGHSKRTRMLKVVSTRKQNESEYLVDGRQLHAPRPVVASRFAYANKVSLVIADSVKEQFRQKLSKAV